MKQKYNIAVAGTGYVGMSIATLLAQHHHVTAVDVIPEKVDMINRRQSPIQDEYIERYLAEKPLDLTATLDGAAAYRDADFVVIAAPHQLRPGEELFRYLARRGGHRPGAERQPRGRNGHKIHHPRGLLPLALPALRRPGRRAPQPALLPQSSCAKARRCTTISTPRA